METGNIPQAIEATIKILNSVSVPVELFEAVGFPVMAARKNLENILASIRQAATDEKGSDAAPAEAEEQK